MADIAHNASAMENSVCSASAKDTLSQSIRQLKFKFQEIVQIVQIIQII